MIRQEVTIHMTRIQTCCRYEIKTLSIPIVPKQSSNEINLCAYWKSCQSPCCIVQQACRTQTLAERPVSSTLLREYV
jgi:hypothetical protein